MLKPRMSQMLKIGASMLFIVAVIIGAWLAVQYNEPTKQEAAQETNNQGEIKAVDVLSSERVAYYTKVLAIFTGVLSGFGLLQIAFLIRTDKTARLTAIAAKRSADAAVGAELPILVPGTIALLRDDGAMGGIVGYPGPVSTFRVNFRNLGRTAAELVNQSIEWRVTDRLPENPEYRSDFPFSPGTFCERGQNAPASIQNFRVNLQPVEVQAISDGTKFLWFYGYIGFKDFLGILHQQRWCTKWQPYIRQPDGSLLAMGFVYDSTTPAEYTKSVQKDGHSTYAPQVPDERIVTRLFP